MTRLALSGSHEVGKTTLIAALAKTIPGVETVGNILRRLEREGFGIRSDTTPLTLARYLRIQLDQQKAAEERHLISDRALVDGLAYVRTHLRFGEARYDWRPEEIDFLEAAARLHATTFDYQVLLPIEFPAPSIESTNNAGVEFRKAVEAELVSVLQDSWPIPVIRATGTVEDRVATLRSLLD